MSLDRGRDVPLVGDLQLRVVLAMAGSGAADPDAVHDRPHPLHLAVVALSLVALAVIVGAKLVEQMQPAGAEQRDQQRQHDRHGHRPGHHRPGCPRAGAAVSSPRRFPPRRRDPPRRLDQQSRHLAKVVRDRVHAVLFAFRAGLVGTGELLGH